MESAGLVILIERRHLAHDDGEALPSFGRAVDRRVEPIDRIEHPELDRDHVLDRRNGELCT